MVRFANWMLILFVYSTCISFNTYSLEIKTIETREFRSGLNRNGRLLETAKTPNCGSEKRIYLVSYSYHQLQCRFGDRCISTHEEPLLPAEGHILHQMCSMQEECRNLTFPLRSEAQGNRTNAVLIKYQCIDRSAQANICGSSMNFTDAVYLTSGDIKGSFSECQCFVNNGWFSVDITDIRLNVKREQKCSPAILYINDRQFSCDANKADYGSVFHDTFKDHIKNAYISLIPNSKTVLPDMVLVKLTPEGTSTIICNGIQNSTTNIIQTSTTAKPKTTNKLMRPSETTLADHTTIEEKKCNIDSTNRNLNQRILAINIFMLVILMVLLLKTACSLLKFFKLCRVRQPIRMYVKKHATRDPSCQRLLSCNRDVLFMHRSNEDNRQLQRLPWSVQETGVDSMKVVNEVDDSESEKKTDDERPVPPPYSPLDEDRPSYHTDHRNRHRRQQSW